MNEDLVADSRADAATREATPQINVTAVQTSPEWTLFSEDGNADGWISSDTTVDAEQ